MNVYHTVRTKVYKSNIPLDKLVLKLNFGLYKYFGREARDSVFALDTGSSGDCRKLKEKSIATPRTCPHAELGTT
ncbi:unnamed protein product, partial [Brenthis ino]